MNNIARQFVVDMTNFTPQGNKEAAIEYACAKYQLEKAGIVYFCRDFAVRFCYSQNGGFSNTVLALSKLYKYDKLPFFVVLVRKNDENIIYLANSTFLSKISHSSQKLKINNIKGSFNGSDIIKKYETISNSPNNFDDLFAIHQKTDWEDNLFRLVDCTAAIRPRKLKFKPDERQLKNIYDSISRAQQFISSRHFNDLLSDLNERCEKCKDIIATAALIDNKNIRGRFIEYVITSDDETREEIKNNIAFRTALLSDIITHDDLGDYVSDFVGARVYTDIKTKLLRLGSAPKAYNIDKFLEKMAEDDSSFFFFIVGINEKGDFKTALCSVFHRDLLDSSAVQHHWAGRATRGVIQFTGKPFNKILEQDNFTNNIDEEEASRFLHQLIDNH